MVDHLYTLWNAFRKCKESAAVVGAKISDCHTLSCARCSSPAETQRQLRAIVLLPAHLTAAA